MSSLLFLCHRIPYPPNKGEKIRAYRILQHFARTHAVRLGCFIDDPDDWQHVAALEDICAEVHAVGLTPALKPWRAFKGLLQSAPLSVTSFSSGSMQRWVDETVRRSAPDVTFVYSSVMGQYLRPASGPWGRVLMDFVDVDSDKWRQYAADARGPLRWVYQRESQRLLAFDRAAAAQADAVLLVSEAEADLFRRLAPEVAARTHAVANGVDADYFSPAHQFPDPFAPGGPRLVFTGTMNYRPNVDAVTWCANEILPMIRQALPQASLTIVGAKPSPEVQALERPGEIAVTGGVPDVRPYMQYADVIVAPLRMARGIQNKVLEGMAMAKPVVTTSKGLEGIAALAGKHLLVADTAAEFADAVIQAPHAAGIGAAARKLVESRYAWDAQLGALNTFMSCGDA